MQSVHLPLTKKININNNKWKNKLKKNTNENKKKKIKKAKTTTKTPVWSEILTYTCAVHGVVDVVNV